MKFTYLLQPQNFIISILIFYYISTVDSQSLSLSQLPKGIYPKTKQFLIEHCDSFVIGKRNVDTTSPSTDIQLRCRDLELETITIKECASNCMNPITCTEMRMFRNEAIMVTIYVKDRKGNDNIVHLPLACQCVLKFKGMVGCTTDKFFSDVTG